MSGSIKDGGPAFPFAAEYGHPAACGGMSLRDWFAGQALPGIIAQPNLEGWEPHIFAKWAYQMADAMLAAREKS